MSDNPYLYALTVDPNKPLRDAQEQIARLTAERDEIQRELRRAETESSMLRVECGVIAKERDEARKEAESWQDDALRMMRERNTAERERDSLRVELWDLQRGFCNVASSRNKEITGSPRSPMQIARDKGWKCFEDEAYGPLED
jgi:uncharacterized coiled-coil DUF342 family protein